MTLRPAIIYDTLLHLFLRIIEEIKNVKWSTYGCAMVLIKQYLILVIHFFVMNLKDK